MSNQHSSSYRARRARAALLLCLLASGCGQLTKELVDLSRLRAAIIKEYGDNGVDVNLNNSTVLRVTFVNSPLNDKSPEERARRAEQTALFVSRNYPSVAEIEEIWVSFVRAKTRFVVVKYTEGLGLFAFDNSGHALPSAEDLPATAADDSLRPVAVYAPTSDQTEVTVTSLQLQGDVNQGLAVSPHFTVPGDATGVRRSTAYPKSVYFDFASYSEKSLFPGEPQIKFFADGKVVFETAEQFSTSKNADGLFSEFLKLEVPYRAFRRLTAGKKLTFKVGDYEYNLTAEQAEALRQMTEYVRD